MDRLTYPEPGPKSRKKGITPQGPINPRDHQSEHDELVERKVVRRKAAKNSKVVRQNIATKVGNKMDRDIIGAQRSLPKVMTGERDLWKDRIRSSHNQHNQHSQHSQHSQSSPPVSSANTDSPSQCTAHLLSSCVKCVLDVS